jgi:hypothetical protein
MKFLNQNLRGFTEPFTTKTIVKRWRKFVGVLRGSHLNVVFLTMFLITFTLTTSKVFYKKFNSLKFAARHAAPPHQVHRVQQIDWRLI